MKRKVTTSIYAPLRWLSLVVVMFVGFFPEAMANSSKDYYYRATAYVSPEVASPGAGKVYIGEASTNSPDYTNVRYQRDGQGTGAKYDGWLSGIHIDEPAERILYLYAQPNDGYLFDHWAENSATGTSFSTTSSTTRTISFKGSNSDSGRTKFNYYAVFVKQKGLIQVKSANESMGSVDIDNRDNGLGDHVTLTAYPDVSNGMIFTGWTKGSGTENSTNYIPNAGNPYELDVTSETKGLYIAHFKQASEMVYLRLQNKATGRFISFYGDVTATDHTRNYQSYNNIKDGYIFQNSLKMLSPSDAQGNPETVFYRTGEASGAGVTTLANLSADGKYYPSAVTSLSANSLTMERQGDGTYHIYAKYRVSVAGEQADMNTYFCDEGGDWLVMKTIQSLGSNFNAETAKWYVYALDENTTEGAFGANTKAKYTKDGYYYTTMYTDFPYRLLDGVEAYYLTLHDHSYDEANNIVKFQKVTTNEVRANMAVVLKCKDVQNDFTATKTVLNRLLPLPKGSVDQITNDGDLLLKGYVLVTTKNGNTVTNNRVRNDKVSMYVLSYDNSLGFYHFNNDYMTPNKAYLDLRGVDVNNNPNAATVTFSFGDVGEGETNKISLSEIMVDDDYAPVYDLLGRQMVGELPKGIYIRNGKKFIVK